MKYIDNELHLIQKDKNVNLQKLASQVKQPFYVYDLDGLSQRYKDFKKAIEIFDIYFSIKSNNCAQVVQTLLKQGAGLDIVSQGEMKWGEKLGCSADQIVFSGVGKTSKELEYAIASNIFQINVESLQELERIGQICSAQKLKARVAYRMNPNVILQTHSYIQTGTSDHKFGMEEKFIPQFIEIIKKYSKHLTFQGLAMHIGSQGLSVEPILEAAKVTKRVYERLKREGVKLSTLDIGGGVGIDYRKEDFKDDLERIKFYGSQLRDIFKNFEGKLLCEPGRILVGRYGWLIGEVQYIKETSSTLFAILNTGMHHLLRPALYQGYHRIIPVKLSNKEKKVYVLAGPICESTDVLARDRLLPTIEQGDFLALCDVGAYGSVMAQGYNMQDKALEVVFSQGVQVKDSVL